MKVFLRQLLFVSAFTLSVSAYSQLRVHSTGRVTVNTTAPSTAARLMINGAAERGLLITANHAEDWFQSSSATVSRAWTVSWVVRFNNQDRFWVQGNGTIVAKDAYFYSDASLKQDIRGIDSPLEKLSKLRGVSFQDRPEVLCDDCGAVLGGDTLETRRFGVIAQEVEAIFPEMVQTGPDKRKMVSYQQLIPVLIEGMKAQQFQIDQLKAELATLKSSIKAPKNRRLRK